MCVIMIAQEVRPTDEMVEKAFKHNDDGAGVAWRENGKVHFEKGIDDVEKMKELCANLPMPYVAHFRIASVGGIKKELTHPFPIHKDAPLMLKGSTTGGVLFHNGTWSQWHDKALESALHNGREIPDGVWSDTRAMAWLIAAHGPGLMEFLPQQRGVMFTPKVCKVFTGPGWEEIEGVWCSNDYFWKRTTYTGGNTTHYGSRVCHVGRCTNRAKAGTNICDDCEKKRTEEAAQAKQMNTQNTGSTGSNGTLVGPVGGGNSTPFVPAGPFLTLKEAETRYRAGDMSKGVLKKFRKEFDRMASKNPAAIKKAQHRLKELTISTNKRSIRGSAH